MTTQTAFACRQGHNELMIEASVLACTTLVDIKGGQLEVVMHLCMCTCLHKLQLINHVHGYDGMCNTYIS